MYILIKTDEPEKLNIDFDKQKAHCFYADTLDEAKLSLSELHDINDEDFWSDYNVGYNSKSFESCKEFFKNQILSSCRLSQEEMEDLCYECFEFLPDSVKRNNTVKVKIDKDFRNFKPTEAINFNSYFSKLANIVNKHTQTKNNLNNNWRNDEDMNILKKMNIQLPVPTYAIQDSLCGALNYNVYRLFYYLNYFDLYISDRELRAFWDFYKRSLEVYAIFYDSLNNTFHVIPKPDEVYVAHDITHCRYYSRYFYLDRVSVPYWLYNTEPEYIDLHKLETLKDVDQRAMFIKKVGIDKFLDKGIIIDTYENYPENEWWAKSEYKLIDMKEIIPPTELRDEFLNEVKYKPVKYAPFLYMKNQTTGIYHLEGVHPKCKTLYDAIKMRYKDLDLPSYDIEDIK